MNKYQEAFERTKELVTADTVDDFIILKELVEKATSKKLDITRATLRCPTCKKQITSRGIIKRNIVYCSKCGQRLDWSEG